MTYYVAHSLRAQVRHEVSGRFTALVIDQLSQDAIERRTGFRHYREAAAFARDRKRQLRKRPIKQFPTL